MMNDIPKQSPDAHRLINKLSKLGDYPRSLVEKIVDVLLIGYQSQVKPGSDIATDSFIDDFAIRLLINQVINEITPSKTLFESAFVLSARAAGRVAEVNPKKTHPGHDATIVGVRYSLKTEADKNIKENFISISKFREGKGLSLNKTLTELCDGLIRVINIHLSNYDRIVILRAFVVTGLKGGVNYELVEIPKPLLEAVAKLGPANFSAKTPAGGSRADVQFEGKRAWTLVFDGSDEKITITKLDVSFCTVHASWFIPSLSACPISDPESS